MQVKTELYKNRALLISNNALFLVVYKFFIFALTILPVLKRATVLTLPRKQNTAASPPNMTGNYLPGATNKEVWTSSGAILLYLFNARCQA